jgi:hypothetical protein
MKKPAAKCDAAGFPKRRFLAPNPESENRRAIFPDRTFN